MNGAPVTRGKRCIRASHKKFASCHSSRHIGVPIAVPTPPTKRCGLNIRPETDSCNRPQTGTLTLLIDKLKSAGNRQINNISHRDTISLRVNRRCSISSELSHSAIRRSDASPTVLRSTDNVQCINKESVEQREC